MRAGDLLLFVDNVTTGLATLVWWVCIAGLGVIFVWRSTQNERLADLRVTGAALMMWVGTDILGAFMVFLNPLIEGLLGNIGLYMSLDAISHDVGSMISAILVLGVGYGAASTALALAGGAATTPSAPAPKKPAGSKKSAGPKPVATAGAPAAPGGPPGPPGAPPGPPGAPPGPPGPP